MTSLLFIMAPYYKVLPYFFPIDLKWSQAVQHPSITVKQLQVIRGTHSSSLLPGLGEQAVMAVARSHVGCQLHHLADVFSPSGASGILIAFVF